MGCRLGGGLVVGEGERLESVAFGRAEVVHQGGFAGGLEEGAVSD